MHSEIARMGFIVALIDNFKMLGNILPIWSSCSPKSMVAVPNMARTAYSVNVVKLSPPSGGLANR
jgi:hypothetical protein